MECRKAFSDKDDTKDELEKQLEFIKTRASEKNTSKTLAWLKWMVGVLFFALLGGNALSIDKYYDLKVELKEFQTNQVTMMKNQGKIRQSLRGIEVALGIQDRSQ